jgi:hypothetical protein
MVGSMKTDLENSKTRWFFGILATTALLINFAFLKHGSRQSTNDNGATVRRDTATRATAEAEHAGYLARYLNSGVSRKPGFKMVGLAVVSEDGKLNRALNESIINRFKPDSIDIDIVSSVFRPQFVSDGLFDKILAGSNQVIDKLELSKTLDMLLLGREEVEYSSDPSLQDLITANMRLELTAVSVATGESQSWTFVSNGAGFKKSESRQMAEERLIKQLAHDTKMSLKL